MKDAPSTFPKEKRDQLQELYHAAGLPLISDAALKTIEFEPFNGTKETYHAWSKKAMAKLKSQKLDRLVVEINDKPSTYRTILERVAVLSERPHQLSQAVGGALAEDGTMDVSKIRYPLLRQNLNGAIAHVKETLRHVFDALMKALAKESSVRGAVENQVLALETDREDLGKDVEMGGPADPHVVWTMLETKYKKKDQHYVRQMYDRVRTITCKTVSQKAVLDFFTALNALEQEFRAMKPEKEEMNAFATVVAHQRRDGLPSELYIRLTDLEENMGHTYKGAELENWANRRAEAFEVANSARPQQSSPSAPTAPSQRPSAPSVNAIVPTEKSGQGLCDYHTALYGKPVRMHPTACRNKPDGWKVGDPFREQDVAHVEKLKKAWAAGNGAPAARGRNQANDQHTLRKMFEEQSKQIAQLLALHNKSSTSSYPASQCQTERADDKASEQQSTKKGNARRVVAMIEAMQSDGLVTVSSDEADEVYKLLTEGDGGGEKLTVYNISSRLSEEQGAETVEVAYLDDHGNRFNEDITALFDSGSPVHIVPNDKMAVPGSVKKLDSKVYLYLADKVTYMVATHTCDIALTPTLIIKDALIVSSMKNIIISEQKLILQGLKLEQENLMHKKLMRIINIDEVLRGRAIKLDAQALLTVKKDGPATSPGLFHHEIKRDTIEKLEEVEPLSDGTTFNEANGTRRQQEAKIEKRKQDRIPRRAAPASANPPAAPRPVVASESENARKALTDQRAANIQANLQRQQSTQSANVKVSKNVTSLASAQRAAQSSTTSAVVSCDNMYDAISDEEESDNEDVDHE